MLGETLDRHPALSAGLTNYIYASGSINKHPSILIGVCVYINTFYWYLVVNILLWCRDEGFRWIEWAVVLNGRFIVSHSCWNEVPCRIVSTYCMCITHSFVKRPAFSTWSMIYTQADLNQRSNRRIFTGQIMFFVGSFSQNYVIILDLFT